MGAIVRISAAQRYRTPDDFWSTVDRTGECWIRGGRRMSGGYTMILWRRRRTSAHRVAWEIANGTTVPPGMVVCHHCDNPPCVRPDHLFVGTTRDNLRDATRKGRNGGLLTPTQVAIAHQLAEDGGRFTDIAECLNVPPMVVQYAVRSIATDVLGMPALPPRLRTIPDDVIAAIRAERAAGATLQPLSRKYGINVGTVSKIVRGLIYRDEPAPQRVPSSCVTNARFTPTDARAMRARAAAGESRTRIAQDYGTSRQHVGRIVAGQVWKEDAA